MTSISAFNDMMEQFMTELKDTFPEEKSLKKYYTGFDLVKKTNPRKCITEFMNEVTPYADKIMKKDEEFFMDRTLTLPRVLTDMNIYDHWTPELSQVTKDAIWQYLQTLYMLGSTIINIPEETLSMIESVAKKCADSLQNGGGLDEKALMSSMSGLFGGLMKNK